MSDFFDVRPVTLLTDLLTTTLTPTNTVKRALCLQRGSLASDAKCLRDALPRPRPPLARRR